MARVPGHAAAEPRGPVPRGGRSQARPVPDPDMLGLGAASRMLGIAEGTLRRWADEGQIPVYVTPGGHRRFSRAHLNGLLPAGRPRRPALARIGASPERIVRAYRRGRVRHPAPPGLPWAGRLPDADRLAFRERGRDIVEALLVHLDATDTEEGAEALRQACELAAAHGRRAAELGAPMSEAVETFLRFRRPFVAELAGIARRRGFDTREATELMAEADDAMDRMLLSTLAGHAIGSLGPTA